MKNITIRVDAPVLLEGSGVTHTGTSWQIASKPNFDILENIIDESLNDTVNLLKYFKKLDIKDSDTIYVRTKYHFSNDKEDSWSRIVSLKGNQQGITLSDVIVATPKVSLVKEKLLDNTENIIITTEPFKMFAGVGNHVSTSWIITDLDDNIVFNRPYDTDNKTSLIINSKILNKEKTYLIKCKHHTSTNMSSLEGKLTFSLYTLDNNYFDIKQLSKTVVNRMLYFKVLVFTMLYDSIDIIIKDKSGRVVKEKNNQTTVTPTIKVSEEHLGKPYVLYIRIKLKNDTHTEYMPISAGTILGNYLIEVDTNVNYLGMMDYIQEINLRGITVQSGYELYDGSILLVKVNDNNIYRYAIENGILVEKGIVYTLPVEDNISLQYINFIPCYNGDVIVNYGANVASLTDQYTVFLKCSYNTVTKKLILKNRVSFDKEWLSTAVSNSAYVTTEGNLYYVPALEVGDDEKSIPLSMYTLDMTTLAKTKIDLPFVAYRHVSFAMVDKTKFIVFGGTGLQTIVNGEYMWERTNDRIYLFDTVTNTFTDVAGLPTDITRDTYNLQSFFRKDGKVVMFNGTRSGPSQGDQTSYVLDLDTYEMSYENTDILNDSVPYRSSVYLRSGDILRISAKTKDPQLVYNYISNTKTAEAIRTKVTTVVPTLFLTVNAGEVINVEDLGRYDKITILGDGILRWQDGDIVREYNSNDLIITRDTTMTQEDFEAGHYARVIKLYAANLTIDNPNN